MEENWWFFHLIKPRQPCLMLLCPAGETSTHRFTKVLHFHQSKQRSRSKLRHFTAEQRWGWILKRCSDLPKVPLKIIGCAAFGVYCLHFCKHFVGFYGHPKSIMQVQRVADGHRRNACPELQQSPNTEGEINPISSQ